jgi:GntR family transcriptional regulator, transcriptional repressor for pyruvate dehydrogenase complex
VTGRSKAAFDVAARLREQIVRGDLERGRALPIESDLTEQLGASRSVVREALRILETEGLVEVRRGLGGGPRVTHPSIVSVAQTVGVHLQLHAAPVTDVWTAHASLVLTAIGQLASAPSEDAARAIGKAVDELEATVGTRSDYSFALTDVAEEIVRQTGNVTQLVLISALREVIGSELAAADEHVGYAATDVQERIVKALRTVVKRIEAGHPDGARKAYQAEAEAVAEGLNRLLPGATVVDVFPWRVP